MPLISMMTFVAYEILMYMHLAMVHCSFRQGTFLPPRWLSGKESACQCRRCRRHWFISWVGKLPWRRKWQHSPVFLPGKSHGQRSLAGYSPQSCKELDMTERLTLSLSLLCRSSRVKKDLEKILALLLIFPNW